MKKFFSIIIIALLVTKILNAQTNSTVISCDKADRDTTELENLPWFGNNAYLEHFLDSIGYPAASSTNKIIGPDKAKFHISIKFWIYRNSLGIGGPNLQKLQDYMDNLNKVYNTDNKT